MAYDFFLYTTREALADPEYVELQTGPFHEAWWLDGSVYVRCDAFSLIDGPLRGRCGYTDPYSTVDVDRQTGADCATAWRAAADLLERGDVTTAVRRLRVPPLPRIDGVLARHADACARMLRGLADFFERQFARTDRIAVVGV